MPQQGRVDDWVGERTCPCTPCIKVWEDYWNDGFCSVIFVTGLGRPNTGKDKADCSGSGNDKNKMMYSVVIDGNFYLLNSYSLYVLLQLSKNGFRFFNMR
jgi:hypothetical protein